MRGKRQLKPIQERVDEEQNEKHNAGHEQQQDAVDAAVGQTMLERTLPFVGGRARYRTGGGRHTIASVGAAGASAG